MSTIKVGIAGGAGYTGGELIRILLLHPNVDLKFVQSKSNAGNLLSDIHQDLLGDTAMLFSEKITDDIDVLFLCVGHGAAKKFLEENKIKDTVKIIDLSTDFRPRNSECENRKFVYGLPEINKEAIKIADNIANPGCFATCIQLAVLPLAKNNLIKDELHINAMTGSTGAGQSLSKTTHFSWRNNNISVYKAFEHQHLHEIKESIESLQSDFDQAVNFVPLRGNFSRGILATTYLNTNISEKGAIELFEQFYANAPFTFISKKDISLKQVINTNKAILKLEKHDDKLLITSAIDNLLKGASGQAVQNMNLMFGLDEQTGLNLKASVF